MSQRFPPRASTLLLVFVSCALAACGRVGFSDVRHHVRVDPPFASADESATESEGDDERVDAPPSDADASVGDAAVDSGFAPDPGISVAPPDRIDPLPTEIDCSDYSAVVACDNMVDSRSGTPVNVVSHGGGVASRERTLTASVTDAQQGAHLETRFDAITGGKIYLRFSLFIGSRFSLSGINLASIGDLDRVRHLGIDLNLVRDGEVELFTSGDQQRARSGSFRVPRDRWLCVLFKVDSVDDASGRARVLIDGDEVVSLPMADTLPKGGITGALAGVNETFFGQGAATLYVDNFLLTRQHPTDCP